MLEKRDIDSNPMITGSSVHNQRIERLWRDVFRCVLSLYHRMFCFLESEGNLEPLDEKDIFALHYIYLPRINQSLTEFQEGWNNHPLSSEHNQTPHQLFVLSVADQGSRLCHSDSTVDSDYGIDDGPVPDVPTSSNVVVPPCTFSLTSAAMQQLAHICPPLADSPHYGMELYCQARQFVQLHAS